MILILNHSTDSSHQKVLDWLVHFKFDVITITEQDKINLLSLNINKNSFIIKVNNLKIDSNNIEGVWFRKIKLTLSNWDIILNDIDLTQIINTYFNLERLTLENYLNYILEKQVCIGKSTNLYINKLIQLNEAKGVGLSIPSSQIITKMSDYYKSFNKIETITKGIYDTFLFRSGKFYGHSDIKLINNNNLIKSRPLIRPSLFQGYVTKKIEIRTFYFKKVFYSMAIFSQENEKTKIDFRNYDYTNPNRMLPIKLPQKTEHKLQLLCDRLDIDTGSFDLIFSPDKKIYFLEVNPIGQYGFLSTACNYNIDLRIAEYFLNKIKR